MSEWWTYTVADFVMFSARTYYRLIQQYNTSLWPLQLFAFLAGIGIVALIVRAPHWQAPALAGLLALAWAWVAVAFLWDRYATIHSAAIWFAAAFGVEAILLAWAVGVRRHLSFSGDGIRRWVGLAVLMFALLAYPLIAVVSGRGIGQAEVFGMLPDPTALGTIGVLLLASGRWRRGLLVIPVLWCLGSGATLLALGQEAAS